MGFVAKKQREERPRRIRNTCAGAAENALAAAFPREFPGF